MIEQLENHMVIEDGFISVTTLEQKVSYLRAKTDSMAELLDHVHSFLATAPILDLDEKKISDFHDWLSGELLATQTELDVLSAELDEHLGSEFISGAQLQQLIEELNGKETE